MTEKQRIQIEVMKILFHLPLSERIEVVERLGKKLRQRNSIETNNETKAFVRWLKKSE